jgi:WD40 repeat protein/DNA-binding SARP family transcriptional activator
MIASRPPSIAIRCLGTFDVSIGSAAGPIFPTDKVRALLAYLALEARPDERTGMGRSHRREALAGMFWPEHAEANALANLRLTLHRLRQALDHAVPGVSAALLITKQTVQVEHASLTVDVARFQALVAESATHPDDDLWRCDRCLAGLSEAVELYGGELLAGFGLADAPAFEEWLLLRRELLHQQALMALHTLASACEQRGDDHQAHLHASRQLVLDPIRESAHRQLMRILARRGQFAEAVAQYHTCRRLLREELGLEPDGETLALYEHIRSGAFSDRLPRQQDNGVIVVDGGAATARLPARPITRAAERTGDEIPETAQVCGRRLELAQLEQWLVHDRCRLVTLLGMGGVGKTTLAAAAARAVADQFDVVIWRSLLNAPPLDELLRSILPRLSPQHLIDMPIGLDAMMALLLDYLSERRCLLVLDNLESMLQPDQPGYMRPDYRGYAQLIQRIAERRHQSCLLLTSRERPQGAEHMDERFALVRTLTLNGLDVATGQSLLVSCGLTSSHADAAALIERYSGNPLALNLVAQTVKDLFDGDVAAFLSIEAPIFDDIGAVLDQQFARLSSLERELLIWLAVEREPATVHVLRDDLLDPGSPRAFLEAVRALQRRSLVEQSAHGLVLQNVITEYLTGYLVDRICEEIVGSAEAQAFGDTTSSSAPSFSGLPAGLSMSALNRYALLKATAKEYVRSSQVRLITQPIIARLITRLGKGGLAELLNRIIATLRAPPVPWPGYAAGNILNLLLQLGVDLRGYDFSHLNIRHAYLQGTLLPEVNFREADLAHAVFTHTFGDILAVHFDPDGQLCVAGLLAGKLCLWRAVDGQLLHEYQISGAGASIAAFSPNGRVLASADTDRQIRLWDVARGQLLHALYGHPETPWAVTFSADGTMLASSGRDGTLRLWDVATGQLRQTFQQHSTGIHALGFSPDGRTLASGDADGTVWVWRVGTTEPLHMLHGHRAEVRAVVFDVTGTMLASGGEERIIRVWRVPEAGGQIQIIHTLHAHTQIIRRLAMSADGRTLASGGMDTFVCLWDVRSGQAHQTLQGHAYPIHHLAFRADGRRLATVGTDQTICLWDVATGQRLDCLQVYSNQIYSVAFSPDGRWLASGGADSILRLWDVRYPGPAVGALQGHTGSIYTVAFSPEGGTLASGGRDGTIRLWNIRSRSTIGTLYGHTNDVEAIAFSPDGRQLASASSDQTVRIWDVRSGQAAHLLHGHTDRVRSVAFSPDGRLVVSGSLDRTVRVWDARSGQAIHTLHGHTHGIKWIVFSRDGQLLASSSYDRTMRLWDAGTGKLLFAWPTQHTTILSMTFHPDGVLLATGATDYTVCLWDVSTGHLRATLRGHTNLIESVHFSPDGRWLASGSADETIRLWDVATGACLQTLRADGPYAGMNIAGVTGISEAQKAALKALGAVDE